jgi:hypothetical protein
MDVRLEGLPQVNSMEPQTQQILFLLWLPLGWISLSFNDRPSRGSEQGGGS